MTDGGAGVSPVGIPRGRFRRAHKKRAQKEALQTLLTSRGEEGREWISAFFHTGTTRLRIIVQRPPTDAVRRKRSRPGLEADPG
jgi:hypothetical protein